MEIEKNEESIKSFVVFDLETNGLPEQQFNACSITELSMYAFSSECLKQCALDAQDYVKKFKTDDLMEGIARLDVEIPELPRCLHKLTLMVNPMRMIHPEVERITGEYFNEEIFQLLIDGTVYVSIYILETCLTFPYLVISWFL